MHSLLVQLMCAVCLISHSLFVQASSASGGYGGNSLLGGSYGGGASSLSGGGYGGGGGGSGTGEKGPITAAVETHRSVEVKPVQMVSEPHEPQVIEVPSDDMPVTVHFKSQSSRVLVQQTHTPAQINDPEHTSSEDEPQRVIHEVVKPVIQEIREIIQPYRRLIQQIQPVIEQTHTVIAKGEPRPQVQPLSVAGASSGSSGGSGSGVGAGGAGGLSSYGSSGGESGFKPFSSSAGSSYAASASQVNPQLSYKSTLGTSSSSQSSIPSSASSASSSPSSLSHVSNASSNRKQHQLSLQQIFSPQSTYSSRRGDFRESAANQPTRTRITLKPAPPGYNPMRRHTQVQLLQPSASQLVPQTTYPAAYTGYTGYHGMSTLTEDDLPLITFVAQPVRYRAARA